jgi:uncharacterized protein YndB with AHSA1/START domain
VTSRDVFDTGAYEARTERMPATITYSGMTPEKVFDVVGDPEKITDWMLLAEDVRVHPAEPGQDPTINVVFAFFGDVYEEVLHWDPPHRNVYLAQGPASPALVPAFVRRYSGRQQQWRVLHIGWRKMSFLERFGPGMLTARSTPNRRRP